MGIISKKILVALDFVAIRLLLITLGIMTSELFLRLCGKFPYSIAPEYLYQESFTESDPQLGHILRPHQAGTLWTGYTEHDETILSNHTRLVTPKNSSPNLSRALILGDSTIYGWGLNDEQSFASRLAALSPNINVTNAAVPGYGLLQSSLWEERIIKEEHPEYVILGYGTYYLERDVAAVTCTSVLAEHSIGNNTSLPYMTLKDDVLTFVPSRRIFVELPGRNYFALVRLLEELIAAQNAFERVQNKITIEKQLFLRWAATTKAAHATPIVFFWAKDDSEQLFREFLVALGVTVINCTHPRQGEPESRLGIDPHPSAMVVDYWAHCIHDAVFTNKPITEKTF